LSGACYHVSVLEIREAEKKLRIVSLLHVISASRGKISIRDFAKTGTDIDQLDDSDNTLLTTDVHGFSDALSLCETIELSDTEAKSLVFIAGYVGCKVINKLSCELCRNELVFSKPLTIDLATSDSYQYLSDVDRGGLKWPTDCLVEIITQVFLVFRVIVSKEYEASFVSVANQKSVLCHLAIERLRACGTVVGECVCGTTLLKLAQMCLSATSNIFINNYCKQACDKANAAKHKSNRKLTKLAQNK
jgi:hypothetical protein